MADNLRISMVQSHIIWEDRDENLGYYGELLRRVSGKTDIAVLPETFTTGFSMDVEKLADTMDGPTIPTIKGWAKKYKLAVAGSFIAKEGGKYFNRAFSSRPKVKLICMTSGICSGWRAKTSISQPGINGRSYGIRTGISVCKFVMIFVSRFGAGTWTTNTIC